VQHSIHAYRIGKVIFPESDLLLGVPRRSLGEGSSIHLAQVAKAGDTYHGSGEAWSSKKKNEPDKAAGGAKASTRFLFFSPDQFGFRRSELTPYLLW
jgi:hypothetical protein